MMSNNAWTVVEINRAKCLHDEGLTAAEIGAQLGRPRSGVIYALKLHGIPMRRGRPTPADPWAEYDSRVRLQVMVGSSKLLAAIQVAGLRP